MEWLPTASEDVLNVATPLLLRDTEWSCAVPSMNSTAPAGIPPVLDLTVAVRVTDCPRMEGFNEEANVVVVLEAVVISETPVEVLGK